MSEKITKIEEGILFVVQDVDELLDEKFQSGEINTEQYLKLSQEIQTYADESRKIIALLRTQLAHGASSLHNFVIP
jgi:hypothetical protein